MRHVAFVSATVSALALAVGAAQAADLPRRMAAPAPAPLYAPAPLFTWTGFYVGGNVGAGWSDVSQRLAIGAGTYFDAANAISIQNTAGAQNLDKTSFTGGLQLGFNYQIGSSFVAGVEADVNYLKADKSATSTVVYPGALPGAGSYTIGQTFKTDWFATLRGRLGFSMDRALIYVTGGAAFAGADFNRTFSDTVTPVGLQATGSSKTMAGWTLGGGLEYAFTPNWTAKAEYLYADLGKIGHSAGIGTVVGGHVGTSSADVTLQVARVGVNYKFGMGAGPVMAKY